MKIAFRAFWLLPAFAAALPLGGQTHRVVKQETIVRAVGVYEWTGDLAKPAASRLIPVTLYIDRKIEDAGVYLARPVPFVLETGNIFELEQSGTPKGTLDLLFARHLQAATAAENYDDGWLGYGTFRPLPKPAPVHKLPASKTPAKITSSADDNAKPHFAAKDGSNPAAAETPAPAPTTTTAADPDRPTMKRRSEDSTRSTAQKTAPEDDPDRPTMKRHSEDGGTATGSSTSADDLDRPTLKRHTAEETKKARNESSASVAGVGSLNEDPDRPNLHRGRPVHMLTGDDLPKMSGLPVDLQQMVAVSDAGSRPVHDFSRPWADDAERAAVLGKMQAAAQAQLAAYGPAVVAVPALGRKAGTAHRMVAGHTGAFKLVDEQIKGFELSYGDVPTFVYQARTEGEGASLRYVTLVAQRDAQGEPAIVLHTITDATHLDRTPRLRLVDAVDIEASNRASLLFEARGLNTRQFAVYRVLGQQAEQTFSTGTMQ